MSEDIREEIGHALDEELSDAANLLARAGFDVNRLADALMPLVARIQAQALREAADEFDAMVERYPISGSTMGDVTYTSSPKMLNVRFVANGLRARADRLEQGDPS